MKNVLIISGHPNLSASVASATILDDVSRALPEAEIRRLDALYPDYQFDIAGEQQALLKADIIVWQFPFSWYSVPGLMKLWIDDVFLHGFAHGSQGQLGGKQLLLSFTTGAPQDAYSHERLFQHRIEDYLPPFATTARLCNLQLQAPIYTSGVSYVGRDDENKLAAQKAAAREHAARLIAAINALAA